MKQKLSSQIISNKYMDKYEQLSEEDKRLVDNYLDEGYDRWRDNQLDD